MPSKFIFLVMKIATIQYTGELSTEIRHHSSQSTVITDAPTDNQGLGRHLSPTDMTACSLGSCMITIMAIKFKSLYHTDLEGLSACIHKTMQSQPRRISSITVELYFSKGNFNQAQQKNLIQWAHECPVALSLHPEIKQVINFNWPLR